MPFKKGQSGNPSGAKKGPKPFLKAKQINRRKLVEDLVDELLQDDNFLADLKKSKGFQKYDILVKLMAFVIPKPVAEVEKSDDDEKNSTLAVIDGKLALKKVG